MKTQLILKGIIAPEDWDQIGGHITYDFLQDGYFAELKHSEMLKERLLLAGEMQNYVGKYYSNEYIRTKILRQNEQEVKEIDKQMEGENVQPEEQPNSDEKDINSNNE